MQGREAEERKLATVLFADLVGSTELAGSQDPERTRAILDRFYDAMADEIERAGGTLEKFVGDAVMAVFGAPAAQEDHAERALHAALAMRRRLDELYDGALELRIGVNTGEVVVGRAREGSSFVTGDAVNVCARLEQGAEPGEILVGERTAAAVRGAFELDEPRTIEAKGKEGGVVSRRLVRALSLMRPRGLGGGSSFVGRTSELDLLKATFRRALELGEPHLVTIMGDAGVGKTRLVRELWQWLAEQEPQPLQRTGRCLPYGQAAYWALGEILKEHLGILEGDSVETVLERLGPRPILGLALGLDVAGDLHPVAARDRLHDAWVDFLGELAAERPVVILLEDLHWAEDAHIELIERVVRDARGPVVVIGTTRPELLDQRPAWGGGRRNASLIWLERLSEEEAAELLPAELPRPLRDLVLERAEGNPFFVEELVGALADRGVLAGGALPEGFAVPDSVQAIVAARIDLLGAAEKAALQAASVIGRVFWLGPVAELTAEAEPDWRLLEDRDFVRRRSGSTIAHEEEYVFKHALTREVAYAGLPKARRAHLHAAFASWLERFGAGRDDLATMLAHHYAEAVRPEDADLVWSGRDDEYDAACARAVHWLGRAGELSTTRYEIDEALVLLERALSLAADDGTRSRLWRMKGRAHALKFDGEAFWPAMERSIELTSDRLVLGETYAELAFQSVLRSGMWRTVPERALVDGWIDRALELTDAQTQPRAEALLARAFWSRNREAAREGAVLAEELGIAELRSYAWDARARILLLDGHLKDACDLSERRFEVLDEISDPDQRADVYFVLAALKLAQGKLRDAARHAAEHDRIASPLTAHHRIHTVGLLLEVDEWAGNWSSIVGLTPRAVAAAEENRDTPCGYNPRSLLSCALGAAMTGDLERADELEQEAALHAMEGREGILHPLRIRLALARGELERVRPLLDAIPREALDLRRIPALAARLDALAALGARDEVEAEASEHVAREGYLRPIALRALGIVRGDRALLEQALAQFETLGLAWHADQTRLLLST
jgi:class 3 adenylate cyclase